MVERKLALEKAVIILVVTMIILVAIILTVFNVNENPPGYFIDTVNDKGPTEHRFMCKGHHFMSLIIDADGALSLRPHPGVDPNGWGSSWYAQPFLPGAVLKHTIINSLTADSDGIHVNASGNVSYGESSTYGTWNITMRYSYNSIEKRIIGNGDYSITLDGVLNETTGDLNLYKITSNYLDNVPLLSGKIGDAGDMEQANVTGDDFHFVWVPPDRPSHFPMDITDYLSIDVIGQYNDVDTRAQGQVAIKPAYKPNLKVTLTNLEQQGLEMIFGAMYNTAESKLFYADNVGITPLILKKSSRTELHFNLEFESVALLGDGSDEDL